MPLRRSIDNSAFSRLPSNVVSVSSSSRRFGSKAVSSRMRSTCSTKSGRRNLQRRDVDGNAQRRPIAPVEAGTAEHELAEFDNQAGMLRNRNETPWRYFALDGMNPARQRLDADQLLAAWIDDRLIDDVQLLISDRLTERA